MLDAWYKNLVKLFRLLVVLGLGSAASASVLPVVEYHKAKALQILFEGGGLACVELPRDASTLDDFERAAGEGRLKRLDSPVWGFTNGTVWCATRVLNASDESTSLHLEFSYGFYDQIVFYQRDEISGDLVERENGRPKTISRAADSGTRFRLSI